uniref:Uncharacterized protein n=1 Tax=Cucumis melo TaxID=3656 RepID=A0A9I9EIV0_CUCME
MTRDRKAKENGSFSKKKCVDFPDKGKRGMFRMMIKRILQLSDEKRNLEDGKGETKANCGLIYHMMLDEIPNNSPDTGESESQVNERRFLVQGVVVRKMLMRRWWSVTPKSKNVTCVILARANPRLMKYFLLEDFRVRKKRSTRKDVIGQKMMRRGACEPKYYHVKVRDAKIVGEEEVCDKC